MVPTLNAGMKGANMKEFAICAALGAGLLMLTACSGGGDFAANTEQYDENQDAALDAQADNLEALADNLRDDVDRKQEEAKDAADRDAATRNAEQATGAANRQ